MIAYIKPSKCTYSWTQEFQFKKYKTEMFHAEDIGLLVTIVINYWPINL